MTACARRRWGDRATPAPWSVGPLERPQSPAARCGRKSKVIIPIVRATATVLPSQVVSNEEIAERLIAGAGERATAEERRKTRERAKTIEKKTGLVERRFFDAAEDPVDVAYVLLAELLERAKLPWSELDGIIVSSSSVHGFPGLSQQLVARAKAAQTGIGDPLVLDIGSNACTSFLYGLGIAASLLRAPGYRAIACLAVEFSSRCLEYHPRAFGTSTLFGDAASAVLLAREGAGLARLQMIHLGSHIDAEKIGFVRGSGLEACDLASPVPANARWYMSGPPVALGAIDILRTEVRRYQKAGVTIDWLIPHQANLTRILLPACDDLGIPREKLCASFERTGNTSSASIPLLLDELLASDRPRPSDDVVLVGFGASFSVASAHLRVV